MTPDTRDLLRLMLQVLFITALMATSVWILRPFLLALVWAVMISIATWPLMRALQRRMHGRRGAAASVMTIGLLVVVLGPLVFTLDALISNADNIHGLVTSFLAKGIPPPPDWVANLPLAGPRIAAKWQELSALGPEDLAARAAPYSRDAARWRLSTAGSFAVFLVQMLLTAILTAILFVNGEKAADGLRAFVHRMVGPRGEKSLALAAQAIRAVALGVVVTAFVQALLGGIGVALAGMPFPVLLAGAMFVLAVAQIGAGPVLLLCIAWLYWKSDTLTATLFLVWSLFVGSIDNVLRPLLIKQGADLPLLLIFAGVIGGLLAFGVIGLFVGPVVLAVAYTELIAWVDEDVSRA